MNYGSTELDHALTDQLHAALFADAVRQDRKSLKALEVQGIVVNSLIVDRFRDMFIVIRSDEHGPPHFHIRTITDGDASFAIDDCRHLVGALKIKRRILLKWYKKNRAVLIKVWNETRPADCPVGPIVTEE